LTRLKYRKGVSTGVAVLAVFFGIIAGAVALGAYSGGLTGNRGPPVTTTETQVVTVSSAGGKTTTVTEKAVELAPTVTLTATVTRDGSAPSRAPSMDLEATQLLYYQGQTVTLVGSIFPPPPGSTGIAVTTSNPLGIVVQVGQAETGITNGTFFYLLSTGTSAGWISGKYHVNATAGGQSAAATFLYSASPPSSGASLSLQVLAPPLVSAGQQVSIAVLATLPDGVLDDVASWSTFAVLFPDGTLHNLCTPGAPPSSCTGTFSKIHAGFYQVAFTLPVAAQRGTYYVEAAGSDASANSTRGVAQFSVP
jgi:hypothetical protein